MMWTKKSTSILLVLCMILSLVCPSFAVLAEELDAPFMTVRVEGYDRTVLEPTEVDFENPPDLVSYGISAYSNEFNALQAIIKALEKAQINTKDTEKFQVEANGYITRVDGLAQKDLGENSGWVFAVNDLPASFGTAQTVMNSRDTVVLYYQKDQNTQYAYFDKEREACAAGGSVTVTLMGISYDETYQAVLAPVENAVITINGEESGYRTDANGQAVMVFDAEGEYSLSATKIEGTGQDARNTISRAHLKVNVTASATDTAEPVLTPPPTAGPTTEPTSSPTAAPVLDKGIGQTLQVLSQNYQNTKIDWEIVDMAAYGLADAVNKEGYLPAGINAVRGSIATEIEKAVIVFSALGIDARYIPDGSGGTINAIDKIANFSELVLVNDYFCALQAYDSGGYEVPEDAKWTKEIIIERILGLQKADGGWNLSPNATVSDPDVTAMTILSLSLYQSNPGVTESIGRALNWLSSVQTINGGFKSYGLENANSSSVVTMALCALGIDADADSRFIKNGNSAIDGLLRFRTSANKFGYTGNTVSNARATEQAFGALVAYTRFKESMGGKFYLYRFGKIDDQLPKTKSVGIRIEGIDRTVVHEKSLAVTAPTAKLSTAYDAAVLALLENNAVFTVKNGQLVSIDGLEKGAFGGEDGWQYLVNGAAPGRAMDEYVITNGDEILIYYGDKNTLLPILKTTLNEDGSFSVNVSAKTGVDAVPVSGVSVVFDHDQENPYRTDEQGSAVIPAEKAGFGKRFVQVFKYDEQREYNGTKFPLLVRLSPDYTVTIPRLVNAGEGNTNIVISDNTVPVTIKAPAGAALHIETNPQTVGNEKRAELPKLHITKSEAGGKSFEISVPQGTFITAADSWDGSLKIYEPENISVSGKQTAKAIKAGWDEGTLWFDKPIRILIPGGAEQAVGFLDSSGVLTEIMEELPEDSLESASDTLVGDVTEAKIAVGEDIAVWTKHLTVFLSYTENQPGPGGPGGNTTKTVRISVAGNSAKGTILAQTSVTAANGDSVFKILSKILNSRGIPFTYRGGSGSEYISSIAGLAEFDDGPLSGWVYYVNNKKPGESVGAYIPKNGDTVKLMYLQDGVSDTQSGTQNGTHNTKTASPSPVPTKEATSAPAIDSRITETISAVLERYKGSSELSHWEAFALAQNGYAIPDSYFNRAEEELKQANGNLRLATDYAALALALKMAGKEPKSFAGYDIMEKIYNNENIARQGLNGYIFSLIAISNEENVPSGAKWTADKILPEILASQQDDGGFGLTKTISSDVDITAMALCALAPYQDNGAVKSAIDKAIAYLTGAQDQDGAHSSGGIQTSESTSQVIMALSELGISAEDPRFAADGKTLIDVLFSYKNTDGSFAHTKGGESNPIATEQAVLALTAFKNYMQGQGGIYGIGGDARDKDAFSDMHKVSSWAKEAVIKAKEYGIVTGNDNGEIEPQKEVTRAEFVTMLLRTMGIEKADGYSPVFQDVKEDAWYAGYVLKAYELGLINGMEENVFDPLSGIKRQDMAVIIARAFGIKAEGGAEIKDIESAGGYAKEHVRAVYEQNIITGSDGYYSPMSPVTKEMAITVMVRIFERQNADE